MAIDRSESPRHRRLQGRRGHRGPGQARRDGRRSSTALVTLESDKATMEVPSPHAGVVKELKVKVGDKVSEGSRDPRARGGSAARTAAPQPAAPRRGRRRRAAAPAPPRSAGAAPRAGPVAGDDRRRHRMRRAGARRRSRRLFGRVPRRRSRHEDVLVERYATLGGVCLNVGCIPSKALLHAAAVIDEARALRRPRHQLRRAEDRPRQAARLQGQGGRQADRRPRRHGEGAQGRGRAPASAASSIRTISRSSVGRRRQDQTVALRQRDHRRRLARR